MIVWSGQALAMKETAILSWGRAGQLSEDEGIPPNVGAKGARKS